MGRDSGKTGDSITVRSVNISGRDIGNFRALKDKIARDEDSELREVLDVMLKTLDSPDGVIHVRTYYSDQMELR